VTALWLVWLEPSPGSFYARLQGLAYDSQLPHTTKTRDNRIVIVDIDEQSLHSQGRWPWPRGKLAELIERLRQAKVAVIGLDILLPEPGDSEGDAALAHQLAQSDVVGAVAFAAGDGSAAPPVLPGELNSQPEYKEAGSINSFLQKSPDSATMAGLADSLYSEAVALGHITPLYDPDFVIRRLQPTLCRERCYQTLAAAMLTQWSGINATTSASTDGVYCVASFCQRLNPDLTLSIPYHHPGQFHYLSATTVLEDPQSLSDLAGAMVLVGTSAVGLGDRVATPLSASTPGVEIHALVLAGLLDSFYWSRLPQERWLATLAIMLIGILVMAWPWLQTKARMTTMGAGLAILFATLTVPQAGYWLNALPLWFALIVLGISSGGWEINRVLSQRRKIYRAFAAYVPPVVLRTLVRQGLEPGKLDAQRADVTVFFADIQGFTHLSEQLEPEQLAEITNHLFSEITEEVYRHKGTLDKFMGDAVMAFWGAPLAQENHPQLAVDCALAVRRRVAQLAEWCQLRGYPEIQMTMGLESGVVTVGNLGSRQRRAYTILGKTVNLAAHLQQQCKQLDHDLLCGPELCRRLGSERIIELSATAIRGIDGLQLIGYPIDTGGKKQKQQPIQQSQ